MLGRLRVQGLRVQGLRVPSARALTTDAQNEACVLAEHPGVTSAVSERCFRYESCSFPSIDGKKDQVVLETLYLSVDPYMRCMFDLHHPQLGEYLQPYELGEALHGGGIGRVLQSSHPDYPEGRVLCLPFLGYEWKRFVSVNLDREQESSFPVVDVTDLAKPSLALGAAGMPGLTAFFCLFNRGKPCAGDTVVVSGAAGACGTLAGQFSKMALCGEYKADTGETIAASEASGGKDSKVIGICGSDEKCRTLLQTCGYDVAINYKNLSSFYAGSVVATCSPSGGSTSVAIQSRTLSEALAKAAPAGVDVYYDNVGGETSAAVLELCNPGARVPICGQIADYNDDVPYATLVSAEGVPPSLREKLEEKAFVGMMAGGNIGKAVVDVTRTSANPGEVSVEF